MCDRPLGGGVFAQDSRENNKKNDQVQQPGAKSVLNPKSYENEIKYCERTLHDDLNVLSDGLRIF